MTFVLAVFQLAFAAINADICRGAYVSGNRWLARISGVMVLLCLGAAAWTAWLGNR